MTHPIAPKFMYLGRSYHATLQRNNHATLLITFQVKLSALVIETVRYFVPNDPSDSPIIHVSGPVISRNLATPHSRNLATQQSRNLVTQQSRNLATQQSLNLANLFLYYLPSQIVCLGHRNRA
jgi:hypothetical protein